MRLSLLFLLHMTATSLCSQSDERKWVLGLQTGLGASRFVANRPNVNFDPYTYGRSFSIFGFAEKSTGKKKTVIIELGFIQKGARTDYSTLDKDIILKYAHFGFLKGYAVTQKWNILIGGELGLMTKKAQNLFNDYKKIDLGIAAQLKYQLSKSLSLGLRFDQSIVSIFPKDPYFITFEKTERHYSQYAHLFTQFRLR
jgi:hypothetical protein